MKFVLALIMAFVLFSCEQPTPTTPIPIVPIKITTTTTVTTTTTIPEKILGPEYAPFNGDFSYKDGRGFDVLVSFSKDKVAVTTTTANAVVYSRYTFVLENGTITTYNGVYPIIWYFECIKYPYRWDDTNTLIVTDPVNNRVLTLRRK